MEECINNFKQYINALSVKEVVIEQESETESIDSDFMNEFNHYLEITENERNKFDRDYELYMRYIKTKKSDLTIAKEAADYVDALNIIEHDNTYDYGEYEELSNYDYESDTNNDDCE